MNENKLWNSLEHFIVRNNTDCINVRENKKLQLLSTDPSNQLWYLGFRKNEFILKESSQVGLGEAQEMLKKCEDTKTGI